MFEDAVMKAAPNFLSFADLYKGIYENYW